MTRFRIFLETLQITLLVFLIFCQGGWLNTYSKLTEIDIYRTEGAVTIVFISFVFFLIGSPFFIFLNRKKIGTLKKITWGLYIVWLFLLTIFVYKYFPRSYL